MEIYGKCGMFNVSITRIQQSNACYEIIGDE